MPHTEIIEIFAGDNRPSETGEALSRNSIAAAIAPHILLATDAKGPCSPSPKTERGSF